MNPETLAIYVQDLSSYELPYIASVLDDIGKEAPQDYKQLWPAIGTMLEAIRGKVRANRPTAEQQAKEKWDRHVEMCVAEGVEEPDHELRARIEKLNVRLSL